jgi:xanthine dehydrogenase YagS FAD-binding subunit
MAVAMRALDAQVETVSAQGGRRVIPIADFHRLPGATPQQDTNLRADEFITTVELPAPVAGVQLYRKVRDRASYAFALVSLAAVIEVRDGAIASARLAFGGLAHKPWRVEGAEALLAGPGAGRDRIEAAADALLQGAQGQGHNGFKIPLARRVLASVVAEATTA